MDLIKIGFGGSCHWCTEAVFQSIIGVEKVDQGWISSKEDPILSEAVIVHFDPQKIDLKVLIAIHLHSHSATSNHTMREKYRSAIYTFTDDQYYASQKLLNEFQEEFDGKLITRVHKFMAFRQNQEDYLNYYAKNPNKPFCQNVINPKLMALRKRFGRFTIEPESRKSDI